MLLNYFPNLTEEQRRQFEALEPLYSEWNAKINVVSRKDIGNIMSHHVLHSLAIAKAFASNPERFLPFEEGDTVLDVGTGGGFPGIPLAILFPEVRFTLCDSIGKKLKVAAAVAEAVGLQNVSVEHARVEDLLAARRAPFSFIVSRAVTELGNFLPWVKGGYSKGIYYLKGGDITDNESFAERGALLQEIDSALKRNGLVRANIGIFNVSEVFPEEFFEEKRVLFITNKKF